MAQNSKTPWLEMFLETLPLEKNIVHTTLVASADVIICLEGDEAVQTQMEIAVASGKAVIVLLGKSQKIGRYSAKSVPPTVELAKDQKSLREKLAKALLPFALTRPTFAKLKSVYETDASKVHNCTISFPNTCAIRMSEALDKKTPGIIAKIKSSGLNICPHDFMRGAQDLASVLRQADVFGAYDQGFEEPMQPPASVNGKKGIICYMNIPSFPDGQGHIDLWDDDAPVGSAYWAANPIWFWHLK